MIYYLLTFLRIKNTPDNINSDNSNRSVKKDFKKNSPVLSNKGMSKFLKKMSEERQEKIESWVSKLAATSEPHVIKEIIKEIKADRCSL